MVSDTIKINLFFTFQCDRGEYVVERRNIGVGHDEVVGPIVGSKKSDCVGCGLLACDDEAPDTIGSK